MKADSQKCSFAEPVTQANNTSKIPFTVQMEDALWLQHCVCNMGLNCWP